MKRVKRYLDITYNKLTKFDWDNCIAVVGDEGVSKSTLGMHIAEYWYNLLNGVVVGDDAKHLCLDRKQFLKDLADLKKFELTVYDEAGDLSSRRAMSKFNVSIMKAYQVIRADNLFTILILPSLWELDSFFRHRRLRGFFYVYKRGCCAYWSKDRMRNMLSLNQPRLIKKYWLVRPLFFDKFPKYKGVLQSQYQANKNAKMLGVRKELLSEDMDSSPYLVGRNKLIKAMKEEGKPSKEIAKILDVTAIHINRIIAAKR